MMARRASRPRHPLWTPSADRRGAANITRFMANLNKTHGLDLHSYRQLYEWSIAEPADFWASVWDFSGILASRTYDSAVDDIRRFPGARWFPGARLNFAQNLLRFRDDRPALVFRGETGQTDRLTYAQLNDAVARLAGALRKVGVVPGDRVAAYMPNLIETAVAMLATTSIGAAWSSCATDIGPSAALARLGQLAPKVLFTADGYFYKGKQIDTLGNAAELARGMPGLEQVVVTGYVRQDPDLSAFPAAVGWKEFLGDGKPPTLAFEQLPFDQPLYIMFSSGTTGKPKCLVQGAGGVLINHLKELLLHTDLRRDDRILYITSCSWMMWNWLLTSLAVGATVVLYDGNPLYPDLGAMWKLIEQEQVTIFGCSASYLLYLSKEGFAPQEHFDLSMLREISQTGSPLSIPGFEYVYRDIKRDLHFNSISGGTDINGCFAAGTPIQPVIAGELQGAALGMKVAAYDAAGQSVVDRQGELVCEAPSPSMPLYFWDDADGSKYHAAYFGTFPGVWRHGDYVLVHGDTGGITFLGRSDAVLKPSGVRIGTAEIYAELERLDEVEDSLAVGQDWNGDQRIVLFVKLSAEVSLSAQLKDKIRRTLRDNASPRHVPAVILQAPDVPYTLNMKKVESAVSNILNGRPVANESALINPGCLDFYRRVASELPS
jgi:acetoacetyl-CoA synthetase